MIAIECLGDRLRIIDQSRLPHEEIYIELHGYQDTARAIRDMNIRGAPAIGVAAGYGIALGANSIKTDDSRRFQKELSEVIETITSTRPTAVNLFRIAERMKKVAAGGKDVVKIKKSLTDEAVKIHLEEERATEKISRLGAELIENGFGIITHCNTGPLATAGYGTALGVIIYAHRQGKKPRIFVDETRPRLQGSKLTAWELKQAGIPFTLITDSMAGHFMKREEINCVIAGADRIAANGYTANKIGTYSLAVLANAHGIPFYIAAPTSTIDFSLKSGYQIPIEEREPEEVTHIDGVRIAPEGVEVANPAFDITPGQYITAIITERGIIRHPLEEGIGKLV
ncbi:MAG: S-methyl-5-thioribose-1-phosphate isomerase [Dehalococcoidia bacterium]|nr:MAG: S-methyl-5-thioribose-1-phosphate isomerase [Dehalococcoidia bacterium]